MISSENTIFGRSKKMGDRAEASRPRIEPMLNIERPVEGSNAKRISEPGIIAQGIAPGVVERDKVSRWVDDCVQAAKKSPIVQVVTLTPLLAEILLGRNESNRPVSAEVVGKYARDISTGRWEFNGEAVIVSEDGKLNDGQHRCSAVVAAGRSIKTIVVFGPKRDTRFTLDQGLVRTAAHYLGMNGVEHGKQIAAVAAWIWQYKELGRLSNSGSERGTKSELLLVVESYRDIYDHVVATRAGSAIRANSITAFCHWAISQRARRPEMVAEFFEKMLTGSMLGTGDPILSARNRLIKMQGKYAPNERAEIIFRAWNMHIRGGHTSVRGIPLSGGELPKLER